MSTKRFVAQIVGGTPTGITNNSSVSQHPATLNWAKFINDEAVRFYKDETIHFRKTGSYLLTLLGVIDVDLIITWPIKTYPTTTYTHSINTLYSKVKNPLGDDTIAIQTINGNNPDADLEQLSSNFSHLIHAENRH